MIDLQKREEERQKIQSALDSAKTQEERNKMGQFSTPIALAEDILNHAKHLLPESQSVRFLDPAFGTGAFFSALNKSFSQDRIDSAVGFEIDEHYGVPSRTLWSDTKLDYRLEDFTKQIPPLNGGKFDLVICNPPYVRHHHINGQKERLRERALDGANMKLTGLAGLYCYFIGLTHQWMKQGGIAGWLIPSEFMDVNYGKAVKDYLLQEVTLLQIHRFDPHDVQFDDALVSSAVVWFKNEKPEKDHKVSFTFGGTIEKPQLEKQVSIKALKKEKKWTRFPIDEEREEDLGAKLSDFFSIKRGIATGDNDFFVLTRTQIEEKGLPLSQFRPILPSPRYLEETDIPADEYGVPQIEKQLFVLDSKLSEEQIRQDYPALYDYLQEGVEKGVSERYLCRNRKIWYAQENRKESQFYCTYIGRSGKDGKKPFRFLLNRSKAIVSNSYLILYPKPELETAMEVTPELKVTMLEALNQITSKALLDEGRVYGGGLHKLEPKELANVPAQEVQQLFQI